MSKGERYASWMIAIVAAAAIFVVRAFFRLPHDLKWMITVILSLLCVIGALFPMWYQRNLMNARARGPYLSVDRSARLLIGPWNGLQWSLDNVVAIQAIVGRVLGFGENADIHEGEVCQVVVVYRTEGRTLRRRLVISSLAHGIESFRDPDRRLLILRDFAQASGLPVFVSRLTGVRCRHALLARDKWIRADMYDLPIDAPPIVDPLEAEPDINTPARKSRPMCRMCGYLLEGLSSPKCCPECGVDFVNNPAART